MDKAAAVSVGKGFAENVSFESGVKNVGVGMDDNEMHKVTWSIFSYNFGNKSTIMPIHNSNTYRYLVRRLKNDALGPGPLRGSLSPFLGL